MDRYIYYRVPVGNADALRRQVLQMQQRITALTGVHCALKRQPDAREGLHTWMEVYTDTTQDFCAQLQAFVAQADLQSLIVGVRHVDDFIDGDAPG